MKTGLVLCALFAALWSPLRADPVTVQVYDSNFNPSNPEAPMTQALDRLAEQDTGVRIQQWGGLMIPGGGGRAALMMAIAGQTGPDIFTSWFHSLRSDIHQGFLYPLNEWVGDDVNGDGQIDDAEAKWDGWKKSRSCGGKLRRRTARFTPSRSRSRKTWR